MPSVEKIIEQMRSTPKNIRFANLYKVCEHHFGAPRLARGSHAVFRTPWIGDPRINIQNDGGRAKEYQVKQVLQAIEKIEGGRSGQAVR